MNFEQWLDDLITPDTRASAAKKAGYAQSTISRQLERGHLRPEMVIALCRAYDRSPVTGLIETGYIHRWELDNQVSVLFALEHASNKQILDELLRRSDPEARVMFGAEDSSNVVGLDSGAKTRVVEEIEAERAKEIRKAREQAGVYEDRWVADSSPWEPGPGDDDYHEGP